MTTALLFPGPMTIALVSSIVLAVALFTLPDTPLLLATSALGGFAVAVVGLIAPLVGGQEPGSRQQMGCSQRSLPQPGRSRRAGT
jgi:hypothetical protein